MAWKRVKSHWLNEEEKNDGKERDRFVQRKKARTNVSAFDDDDKKASWVFQNGNFFSTELSSVHHLPDKNHSKYYLPLGLGLLRKSWSQLRPRSDVINFLEQRRNVLLWNKALWLAAVGLVLVLNH